MRKLIIAMAIVLALLPTAVTRAQGRPTKMIGTLRGTVNGVAIDAKLDFTMDYQTGLGLADISPIPESVGYSMLTAISVGTIAGPTCGTTTGGALNGAALYRGNLSRVVQMRFEDRRELTITYTISYRGGDAVNVVGWISGQVPVVPAGASIRYPSFTDLWWQRAPDKIRKGGTRYYSINGGPLRTVTHVSEHLYDGKVQMPFTQSRTATDIEATYNPQTQTLHFATVNVIAPARVEPGQNAEDPATAASGPHNEAHGGRSEAPRFEVGGQFTSLNTRLNSQTQPGVGARLTYNATERVAFETEANVFPREGFASELDGGRVTQAFVGVKIKQPIRKFAVFGTVKPGVQSFGRAVTGYRVERPIGFGLFVFEPNLGRKNVFALNWGGGVELCPESRVGVRFDVGDTVTFHPGRTSVTDFRGTRVPRLREHNLQVSSGLSYRF